jgi:hypothetical protein
LTAIDGLFLVILYLNSSFFYQKYAYLLIATSLLKKMIKPKEFCLLVFSPQITLIFKDFKYSVG